MDQAQKLKIADDILQSKEFEASERLKQLLKYLVHAHLQGETLKEVTIANEVFHKGGDAADSDYTTVRSSVYQLRKKLTNYYNKEGRGDKYRLVIPKGHYRVKFIANESTTSPRPDKKRRFIYAGFSFLLVFLLIIVLFQRIHISQSQKNAIIDHSVWRDIKDSKSPILLVFADGFCFREYNEELQRTRRIQDFDVRSSEDLVKYPFYKNKSIYLEHFSIIGQCVIPNLIHLLPPLQSSGKQINYKLSSELTWHDLANNNIIYMGPPQSLCILESLFERTSFDYFNFGDADLPEGLSSNARSNYFYLKSPEKDSLVSFKQDYATPYEKYRKEHAVIVKMPNPKGENTLVYLFTGFNLIGRAGAVENFASIDFLEKLDRLFNDKFGKKPHFFEILIEVAGFPSTPTNARILYVNEIKTNF